MLVRAGWETFHNFLCGLIQLLRFILRHLMLSDATVIGIAFVISISNYCYKTIFINLVSCSLVKFRF